MLDGSVRVLAVEVRPAHEPLRGLDGEKVDYEWKNEKESVFVKFEDGRRVQVTSGNLNERAIALTIPKLTIQKERSALSVVGVVSSIDEFEKIFARHKPQTRSAVPRDEDRTDVVDHLDDPLGPGRETRIPIRSPDETDSTSNCFSSVHGRHPAQSCHNAGLVWNVTVAPKHFRVSSGRRTIRERRWLVTSTGHRQLPASSFLGSGAAIDRPRRDLLVQHQHTRHAQLVGDVGVEQPVVGTKHVRAIDVLPHLPPERGVARRQLPPLANEPQLPLGRQPFLALSLDLHFQPTL
jgi:hypothetical protein